MVMGMDARRARGHEEPAKIFPEAIPGEPHPLNGHDQVTSLDRRGVTRRTGRGYPPVEVDWLPGQQSHCVIPPDWSRYQHHDGPG